MNSLVFGNNVVHRKITNKYLCLEVVLGISVGYYFKILHFLSENLMISAF